MKEDTTLIDRTWIEKTGGYAKGMTLRDYFAAMAMQGLLANQGPNFGDVLDSDEVRSTDVLHCYSTAQLAYDHADVMLAIRNGEGWPDMP